MSLLPHKERNEPVLYRHARTLAVVLLIATMTACQDIDTEPIAVDDTTTTTTTPQQAKDDVPALLAAPAIRQRRILDELAAFGRWIEALEEREEREREERAREAEPRDVSPEPQSADHENGTPSGPQWNAAVGAWCWLGCIAPSRPCAIPEHICRREARFIDQANNEWHTKGHTACGKYQFVRRTWANFGGYPTACLAPEEVQDAKAAALWASPGGPGHWGK